jgi:hypothetical protein
MTFPILGGNGAVAGYSIDNSLRFNDGDSARLSITPSTTQTSNKIGTLSYWVKRSTLGTAQFPWHFYPNRSGHSNDRTFQAFDTSNRLTHERILNGSNSFRLRTNRLFRDVGAWYHILLAIDTTQATASNRMKLYVNGVQETDFETSTYPSQNQDIDIFEQILTTIGVGYSAGSYTGYFDGYLAEFYGIDGQALSPTDFGEFDDSGIWKPIEFTGTFGNNGFYLDFSNSSILGEDFSGNDNDFTATNLASTDQTTDTPTNNFATLNPLVINRWANAGTPSEGNTEIKWTTGDADTGIEFSTMGVTSGKWYWEVKMPVVARAMVGVGYMQDIVGNTNVFYDNNPSKGFALAYNGSLQYDATSTTYGSSFSNNDILQVALDMDNHLCWFGLNGTWQNSATQSEIENSTSTNDATTKMGTQQNLNSGQLVFPFVIDPSTSGQSHFQMNFGNPAFSISSGNSDGNGYGNFEYAPPSGYLALCTQNLATELSPTIDDGSAYFQSTPYTGNGSDGYAITNSGYSDLQPDFVWIKKRNSTSQHVLTDSSRGVTKQLFSSTTQSEQTSTEFLTSFNSDGFTTNNNSTGTDTGDTNIANGDTYVAWQWKASGGSTSSNTSGSITSTVQANTTAGFSIVTYTGTGSNATVGHGLGVVPDMVIVKNRSSATDWGVQMANTLGFTNALRLNLTDAYGGSNGAGWWNDTAPTSTTVSIGTRSEVNTSGNNYLMLCFNNIEGYSKFGSYTGNGSTDGTFVYTGFRPAWVMIKVTDTTEDWWILDTTRDTFNSARRMLYADGSSAEINVSEEIDFLSNGFKLRRSTTGRNGSGNSYIYMAFAESPFVTSTSIPVTAR